MGEEERDPLLELREDVRVIRDVDVPEEIEERLQRERDFRDDDDGEEGDGDA